MIMLYIGGATRSGSTLTEMILGNLPGFFSVGEVKYFWEHYQYGDIQCGCGAILSECVFWSQVITKLQEKDVDFARMAYLANKLDRTRNLPWLSHSFTFDRNRDLQEFVTGLGLLYSVIDGLLPDKVVIDSSKMPSHIYMIRRLPDIDLRLLHLVRDGRAVAYSWNKRQKRELKIVDREVHMQKRSLIRALSAWSMENFYIARLKRQVPYYTLMKYEDFTQAPVNVLDRAVQELGFQGIDTNFLANGELELTPNHSVNGNPIRFAGKKLSIVSDLEWRRKMSRNTRIAMGLVAAPLLLRFKYEL